MTQQTQLQPKYKTVRSVYRRRVRSRKSALPAASALFLASVLILAVYYARNKPANNNNNLNNLNNINSKNDLVSSAKALTTDPASLLGVVTSRAGGGDYGDLCTVGFWSRTWLLAFLIPAVIFAFVGLALVTDDYFVAALERICERLDLTEDVAGATFMAAGSSTPEFFASMLGTFVTRDSVGIGTIVGSAVFNILVIVGVSAALAGSVLELDWRPLMRDSFFYVVSIGLLLLFTLAFGKKGAIKWYEGLILTLTYVVYVLFMAYLNKPYMRWAQRFTRRGAENDAAVADLEQGGRGSIELGGADAGGQKLSLEQKHEKEAEQKARYRNLPPRTRLKVAQYAIIAAQRLQTPSSSNSGLPGVGSREDIGLGSSGDTGGGGGVGDGGDRRGAERREGGGAGAEAESGEEEEEENEKSFLGVELPSSKMGWIIFPFTLVWSILFRYTILDCSSERRAHLWYVTFALSIVWISGISYVMVEAARIAGCLVGIPATAMGLTVLAAGTSVPDALASISVARGGAGDMAVSNAIGSNVFDILLGLGVPWFIGDLALTGTGDNVDNPIMIPTEPLNQVVVPIVILFGILVVFVVTLMLMRWRLSPKLGYTLFALYAAFVAYTLIDVYLISSDK